MFKRCQVLASKWKESARPNAKIFSPGISKICVRGIKRAKFKICQVLASKRNQSARPNAKTFSLGTSVDNMGKNLSFHLTLAEDTGKAILENDEESKLTLQSTNLWKVLPHFSDLSRANAF